MFWKKNKLGKLVKKEYSKGNDYLIVKEHDGKVLYSNPVSKNKEIPDGLSKRCVAHVEKFIMPLSYVRHILIHLEEER